MQKFYVVLALLLLLAVAVFALANHTTVAVSFPGLSNVETSVAILILVSFITGVLLMGLIDLVRQMKSWKDSRELLKKLHAAEEERDLLKNRVEELTRRAQSKDQNNTHES